MKESGDVSRAEEDLVRLNNDLDVLQDKLQDDLDLLQDKFDLSIDQLETIKIRPKKTNISVKLFSFTWIPLATEDINDIEEIEQYFISIESKDSSFDSHQFLNYNQSRDWMVGSIKMKDWKAAVRTWEQRHPPEVDNLKELKDWANNPDNIIAVNIFNVSAIACMF